MATTIVAIVVILRLTRTPMMSRRRRKNDQRDDGKGQPKTEHDLAEDQRTRRIKPNHDYDQGGHMVINRRSQGAMRRLRKPCMMTWPDMVPTEAEERPDASSEIAKIELAACPSSGSSVR